MNTKKLLMLVSIAALSITGCHFGQSQPSQNSLQTNKSTINSNYQFVVDSGSSGSRVYVYQKILTESGVVLTDLYEQKTSIPLASFATNPNAAATSIAPLLTGAIQFIQKYDSSADIKLISTSVLGTAGMRLIEESQQSAIYANVTQAITDSGLAVGKVETITGQYEGVYSWADVNYLQSNFNTNVTNGIVEVGGASAQVAFATSVAPEANQNIVNVSINGKNYNVFATSFLGLGQDYARGLMHKEPQHNQCYPIGYTYSGSNAPYFSDSINIDGHFSASLCSDAYTNIINKYADINKIHGISNFYKQKFVGVSSVYYALSFWGIEQQPALLLEHIQETCSKSYADLQVAYPSAFSLQNQCANSVLINDLLFNNLKMKGEQLRAVPSINGTNLSYTLGFALLNN